MLGTQYICTKQEHIIGFVIGDKSIIQTVFPFYVIRVNFRDFISISGDIVIVEIAELCRHTENYFITKLSNWNTLVIAEKLMIITF